jgi:hypothetical protein
MAGRHCLLASPLIQSIEHLNAASGSLAALTRSHSNTALRPGRTECRRSCHLIRRSRAQAEQAKRSAPPNHAPAAAPRPYPTARDPRPLAKTEMPPSRGRLNHHRAGRRRCSSPLRQPESLEPRRRCLQTPLIEPRRFHRCPLWTGPRSTATPGR